MNRRFLWSVTLGVCISILVAGLWPFKFHPENGVSWLDRENGVRFSGRGVINGEGGLIRGGPMSIEIWLRPGPRRDRGVPSILSLYNGSRESFYLGQWKRSLILRNIAYDGMGRETHEDYGAWKAFPHDRKSFVTITFDTGGTTAYLDGRIAKSFPGSAPSVLDRDASQSLVLGCSPMGSRCWSGEIFGLAVYGRALSTDEVSLSYHSWMDKGMPQFPPGEGPIALYLFDERAGSVVHNHQGPLHRLVIPAEFRPPLRTVLVPPWRDFALNRSYLEDILVNISGFVPFGFFVSALLINAMPLRRKKAFIAAVLMGAVLSLSIELVQVYLPTRDSQLSDVIDNTLGTVIGAVLFALYGRRAGS